MSGEGLSQRGAEFQLQPVPASKRKRSTANNEKPRILVAPQPSICPPVRIVRPAQRLRRAQSVPNLKARYSLDLSITAQHTIAVPAPLAQAWSAQQQRHQQQLLQQQQQIQQRQNSWNDLALRPPCSGVSVLTAAARPSDGPSTAACAGPSVGTPAATPNGPPVHTPSTLPPINSQTLKELDLHEILKNPQLRHDLVFDADLQFRPNFDGERGRRKRDVCNKYWRAVQREIVGRCSCTSFYGALELPCVCAASERRRGSGTGLGRPSADARSFVRIPNLIAELRCICISILPTSSSRTEASDELTAASAPPRAEQTFARRQRDHVNDSEGGRESNERRSSRTPPMRSEPHTAGPTLSTTTTKMAVSPTSPQPVSDEHAMIMQCLDPVLIMQQIRYGALDVVNLITKIGSILKQHCAPMRDTLIDKMIDTVTQQGDVTRSLRQCFEVLELMKLDVANHQLSTSRVYLVDTAAEFEGRWFRDQVLKGKLPLHRTVLWFSARLARQRAVDPALSRTALMSKAFDEAVLDLIFDPPPASAPRTAFGAMPSPCRSSTPSTVGPQVLVSASYPETFQFDASRLLTFHGEVTDITVVSMLLLLFRQLACSPQNLASQDLPYSDEPSPASAALSAMACAQQESVKSEVWTLLREAEADMASPTDRGPIATTASTPTLSPPTPGGVASRVLDSRLSSWRKVMGDIVLQVAARAIQVQIEARIQKHGDGSESIGDVKPSSEFAPSQSTIVLLTRWLETNLHSSSPLLKLCRSRVRTMLARFTATGNASCASVSSVCAVSSPQHIGATSRLRADRKRVGAPLVALTSSKRAKLQSEDVVDTIAASMIDSGVADVTESGDLEPFRAEVVLLSERIKKVKTFHLHVYRVHYERLAGEPRLQARMQKQEHCA